MLAQECNQTLSKYLPLAEKMVPKTDGGLLRTPRVAGMGTGPDISALHGDFTVGPPRLGRLAKEHAAVNNWGHGN